ncbi:MAG: MmcQ/YjbR family DNA-binding protein [Bryobacterales bacterium]|nr:MmcQ/YjbR family DNA-binding protein [Bryobacterales bacterium]
MQLEQVRAWCLSLPAATEQVQWGNDLVFKVAGKMFAVAALEPGSHVLSCKVTPEEFAELIERPGIVPAPYLARAHWVAVERFDVLRASELERLVRASYALVVSKLPKSKQPQAAPAGKPAKKKKGVGTAKRPTP